MDQYVNFNSSHPLHTQIGIVQTLSHRWDKIITTQLERERERKCVKDSLKRCRYPEWSHRNKRNTQNENYQSAEERKYVIFLPYTQGVSENLSRILKKHDFALVSKPATTLRTLLVNPNDKPTRTKHVGLFTRFKARNAMTVILEKLVDSSV